MTASSISKCCRWVGCVLGRVAAASILVCLTAVGCAQSGNDAESQPPSPTVDNPRAQRLVGSWQGIHRTENAAFAFASIAFQSEGTYSARLLADGQAREQSGRWQVEDNALVLDKDQRWELEFRGQDTVVFRDPEMRVAHVLVRK